MVIAGIVTYNPNLDLLLDELTALEKQHVQIVVVDNFSKNIAEIEKAVSETKNATIVKNKENFGIAKALNQVFNFAEKVKAEWVLTLDQDSLVIDNVAALADYASELKCGIISPKIVYKGKSDTTDRSSKSLEDKDWVITSGSLTNFEAWRGVGGFDEKMFIDLVDFDFCYRIKQKGYRVIQNNNILMHHHLGELRVRRFLFWKINVGNHSSLRKYYMSRNCFYLRKKNEVSKRWSSRKFWLLILESLYEKDKCKKIAAIFRGRKDAKKMAV